MKLMAVDLIYGCCLPLNVLAQEDLTPTFPSTSFDCRQPLMFLTLGITLRRKRVPTKLQATADPMSTTMKEIPNSFPSPDVLKIWRKADAVCFDVDSTVCEDEGIDELAAYCGAGEAVAAWTARAMGGAVLFEEALAARLALFSPSSLVVSNFLASKPPRLSVGIVDLVSLLHARGKAVYLVSGGFRQMITPIAVYLNIPQERIFANNLLFGVNGEFLGFDVKEPTSRSGGKATVVAKIKEVGSSWPSSRTLQLTAKFSGRLEHRYRALVMVGDGATDLEVREYRVGEEDFTISYTLELARRPEGADLFICYGGVQKRPTVMAGADWVVEKFEDLIKALDDFP